MNHPTPEQKPQSGAPPGSGPQNTAGRSTTLSDATSNATSNAWSYRTLLTEFAMVDGLSASTLLETEELLIGDTRIGLLCDGDDHHGDIMFYTSLGKPAPQREPNIDRLLMEANHLGVGTAGCTLGRHAVTGAVTLCARSPIALTQAASLSDMLQSFHAIASLWRDEIGRSQTQALRYAN